MRFDANLIPHHHVRCLSCGTILDVKPGTQLLDDLLARMSEGLHSAVPDRVLEDARVELRGCCRSCRDLKPESPAELGACRLSGESQNLRPGTGTLPGRAPLVIAHLGRSPHLELAVLPA